MPKAKRLDDATKEFTASLKYFLTASGYEVGPVFGSGNIVDGPGWVFEATDPTEGITYNVEVAGPAYES